MTKAPKEKSWSALAFDKPFESDEHQMLVQDLWLVGYLHGLRYWLGRLCGRNLYCESDESVIEELRRCFLQQGWQSAIVIVSEPGSWNCISDVLQLHAHVQWGIEPPKRLRETRATEIFLKHPLVTDQMLAKQLNTTEKQIARLGSVSQMRSAFVRAQAESEIP